LKYFYCHLVFVFVLWFALAACSPVQTQPAPIVVEPTHTQAPSPTTPAEIGLWLSPSLPAQLRNALIDQAGEMLLVTRSDQASVIVDLADDQTPDHDQASRWVYALVAPFPTVIDGVTMDDVRGAWRGDHTGPFAASPLWMDESTLITFTALWGEPAAGAVNVPPADQLIDALWMNQPSWGIMPFERLDPKLKVLTVDDQSPIRKEFDVSTYPLTVTYALSCAEPCSVITFPATNRDTSKLTTVVLTGVTALVRATAYKMELNGIEYPARDIRDWLLNADIAHISNEIPFADRCPFPKPGYTGYIFCSDPKYIGLLEYVGMDVVELTGNHFMDWGKEATLMTVQMYRDRNLPYFGGGANLDDARKPAKFEVNGNKIAFIGCKPDDNDGYVATVKTPGAAPCGDLEWLVSEIKNLRSQGYLVIATFQHFEYYTPEPRPRQLEDFRKAAEAGAIIVSGSQAHYAQAMEFYNGSFIHYGLGNFFFDQMGYDNPSNGIRTTDTRKEFVDRHVFYDGKYIGTELLTAMLEDYARPRPMTMEERAQFLLDYFAASGWVER
jgi:poly-gamma-glutamate synthesis protein (capsule biosynthesis protein)